MSVSRCSAAFINSMTISRSRASMTVTAAATSRASHAARSPSARRARSSARRFVIRALTSTASKGFCRKSVAPASSASRRSARASFEVTMTIGTWAKPSTCRAARMKPTPFMPGMS